jgi:predicted DNA-binding transcriptional regulator YafY
MLATSARLLRLLSVLQARRFWTGQDLAERLEIEPRTLRRDVDRLRSLGYTIDSTSGPGGGYQLGTGATLPPVLFEDDEAVAIAVALQGAAQSLAGFDEVALRTLVKLLQILPARLRPRVEALRHATIALSGGVKGPPANLLAELAAACRELHTLSFDYRKPRGAETEKRSAEPVRLVSTGSGRWYLLAWDLERGDFRTFRVDRIVGEPVRGQPFARREPPADITRYLRESLTVNRYPLRARARLAGSFSELSERLAPWCGVLEPLDDTHCLLTFGADSEDALVGHLLLTGADFEVLEPRELKASMRRLIRRLERAAASHDKVRELRVVDNP